MTTIITATVPVTIDTFMHEHIRQLEAAGEQVVVVSSPGPRLDRVAAAFPDVTIEAIPMARAIAPRRDLVSLVAWLRLLRRTRPTMIVSKTPKASLLSMLAGMLTGVPRRVYATGGLRLEGAAGIVLVVLTLVERLTCWASTEVVANSPSLAAEYARRRLVRPAKLRSTLSGQGVDCTRYARGLVEPLDLAACGLDPSLPVIGFVGRVTADKGIGTLVQAFEYLSESNLQLLVVGPQDEPDSPRFVDALRRIGRPVAVLDALTDVRAALETMDILVLPSSREGFPNAVLEAAAMGIPAVTTDATGCVDSVCDGRTGLVVPVGDPLALSDAIGRLASDADLRARLGRAARTRAQASFQPAAVVRELLHGPEPLGAVAEEPRNGGFADLATMTLVWGHAKGIGGTETRMAEIVSAATAAGIPVECWFPRRGDRGPLVDLMRTSGAVVRFCSPLHAVAGRRLGTRDMVIAFGLRASLACRAARVASRRWPLVDARNGLEMGRGTWTWRLDVATQRFVSRYVCNSSSAAEVLRHRGVQDDRVAVVYSALSEAWDHVPSVPRDPDLVIMVGNSRPEKNHLLGLRALLAAAVTWRGLKAIVYMDDATDLRREWAHVPNSGELAVDFVEGHRLTPSDYARAAVLLHPSLSESFPRAVLEAASQGTWTIASDAGDSRTAVGQMGEVVTELTVPSIVDALLRSREAERPRPTAPAAAVHRYMSELVATAGLSLPCDR